MIGAKVAAGAVGGAMVGEARVGSVVVVAGADPPLFAGVIEEAAATASAVTAAVAGTVVGCASALLARLKMLQEVWDRHRRMIKREIQRFMGKI